MRSSFTYRLNEEKIRRQLRENVAQPSEDAWQRFTAYADSHSKPVHVRKLPSFKIPFSGRALMPIAAAVVLILVTILTLNVVNIGEKKSAEKIKESSEPFVPMPQVHDSEVIMPGSMAASPKPETQLTQNVQALQPDKPEVKPPSKQEKKDADDSQSAVGSGSMQTAAAVPAAKTKTRVQVDIEPIQLPDIRPTLLTPEQEENIRPN